MYHHFRGDQRKFKDQCEHIRRFYHPVTLREVADCWKTGRRLPPNSIAITVDDGYGDFLENGYPVLRSFDIPSTMFLVSDFLDGKIWLWWNVVEYALARTQRTSLTLTREDGAIYNFDFGTIARRSVADQQICDLLRTLPNRERVRLVASIVELLEVELPVKPPPKYAPIAWDDVRLLADDSVEFGAHTKTHAILSRISERQTLAEEIEVSKSRIEEELGRPVIHFCYPNGRSEDISGAAVELVANAGFQTAVTAERGINYRGAQPLLLKRLGVEPDTPIPYFSELLAGVRRD